MKINNATELMKNQKHAVIMSPDKQFEVLQTQEGHSLFFSIGTDNIFYCTREVPADKHGWTKVDLSSALSANYKKATVSAKTFDVAQNLATGTTDMALVITVNNNDYLYLSLGNANTDAAWNANTISWTAVPYDDTAHSFTGLCIADVYITQSGNTEYVVADIVTDPSSPVKSIYRYFIDPTKKIFGNAWHPHDISGSLEAGNITNLLGRKKGDAVDAVYTMGTIINEPQLIYTPLYNPFNKNVPGQPTVFVIPANATAMALSFNDPVYSDLFVAAGSSLYFIANNAQKSGQPLASVYTNPLLNGVESLHVNNYNSQVTVWGLSQQGQIFYLKCAAGSETNTTAWSLPVPLLDKVSSIASFVNNQHGHMVIFAHMQDDTLIQLTQDAVTKSWQQRSIVLPPADVNDMIETYTFTTHIKCTDDNNIPLSNAQLSITSNENCTVYINDIYHILYTNDPLQITSDATGVITIIQSVDSIGGVCYNLSDGTQKVNVNPMTNILNKLNNVNTGSDLNLNVTDERGKSTPLVPTTVTGAQKDQIAAYVKQFVQLHSQVPADGTQKPISREKLTAAAATTGSKVFGMSFKNNTIQYFEGYEQAASIGLVLNNNNKFAFASAALTGAEDPIEILAGDAWRWLKHFFQEVETFFIQLIGDISHFFITIGKAIYHFALRCINDIIQGIEFVFNKILIAFEDLIKWLGNIFGWNDIIRTHRVLKNMFNNYAAHCIGNLATYRSDIINLTTTVEKYINTWAGLPMDSYQSQAAANNTDAGQNNPSSNWGCHHTKSNIGNANITSAATDTNSMLDDLFQVLINEGKIFASAADQLKNIFKNFASLSMADFVKQILAVIADAVLESTENVLTAFLKIAEDMIEGVLDILNAKLNIPIISPIYKLFVEDDLTMLDLVCIVAAIPVTFIYKLMNKGAAPFADDADTEALLDISRAPS